MNNKYTIAAGMIIGMVIAITLITYSNFNLYAAFGDHGEGFEDTYGDWYEKRDDSSNYYQQQPQQQQQEK